MTVDINSMIKKPVSHIFRRAQVKRRSATTGLFESDWLDISKDVKSYGKVTNQIDAARRYKFTFGNAKLVMENTNGRYNPSANDGSLWSGYLNQQRTLVRYQAGYRDPVLLSSGVWLNNEYPSDARWDVAFWDAAALWDAENASTVFTGIVSGDILSNDKNEIIFNLKPLSSLFQEYPARNLVGWTTTGMTASQFVTMVRDQTDGSGSFIFRPFFENTTTYWDISSTSNVFANLNTSGAKDVIDKTVWDVIEKLAEAENFVPYITRSGVFKFISRDSVATSTTYSFYGAGTFNSQYGYSIKTLTNYGFKASKYYSRVRVKFLDSDTTTSYHVSESTLTVSATSNPWVFGNKTLAIDNYYIATTAMASSLATTIFNDVSAYKNEVEFSTTLVPHLDVFDRFSVSYNPSEFSQNNLWDQNDWAADVTATASDLIWDKNNYDSLVLDGQEFKFLSFEIDLDNFSNKFIAREV